MEENQDARSAVGPAFTEASNTFSNLGIPVSP